LGRAAAWFTVLFAVPGLAQAHLVSTGVGPFYDGAAHFFVSFEELLPVLALSLFSGLRGPDGGRRLIAILPIAWIAAGAAGLAVPGGAAPALGMTLLLLATGALLASDRAMSPAGVAATAAAVGLWAGFWNGRAMAAAGAGARGMLGAAAASLLLAILAAALAASFRTGWTRIAIRVAGSWIAALGILALGWNLRR
jgi:hydrogenase/urease accessory protein HupE